MARIKTPFNKRRVNLNPVYRCAVSDGKCQARRGLGNNTCGYDARGMQAQFCARTMFKRFVQNLSVTDRGFWADAGDYLAKMQEREDSGFDRPASSPARTHRKRKPVG